MFRFSIVILVLCFMSCNTKKEQLKLKKDKVVIAHRGASGYLPEHTLESKVMAYAMDADFIGQDIVLSQDNVPIVIHDIHLEAVTDVALKFPNRKRKDGSFYVIDFTFNELKTLNVFERINPEDNNPVYATRFPINKSRFQLHSLQEEIELIQGLNKSTGKNIGIYPEIKEPSFHKKEGKDISKIVLKVLDDYGYRTKMDKCILQCFDSFELKRVRDELKSELFLLQLIEFPEDEEQLKEYAKYADGIGPWYYQIIMGKDKNGHWQLSDLVEDAHNLKLEVHAYTFRTDKLGEFKSFENLLDVALNKANVDGVITDFPDKVVDFINKN